MIEVRAVSVSYNGSPVVAGVEMSVGAGEWVGLIGPNGAGKTSLLRAMAGSVRFTGEIEVAGRPVSGMPRRDLGRTISVVPQSPVLPPGLPVLDYVLLGRTPHLGYLAAETDEDVAVVEHVLWDLGLIHLADRDLRSLSGGESQRAVLARALVQEAPVLLLDEPTSALDIGRGQQVLELVDRLRAERGLAVVSAMHDLTLVSQYTDRILLMLEGKVTAEGSASEVLTPERLRAFSGANVTVVAGPSGEPVVVPVRTSDPEDPGVP